LNHIVYCPINKRRVNKIEFCGFKKCDTCDEPPISDDERRHLIKTPRKRKKVLQHATSLEQHLTALRLYAIIVRKDHNNIPLDDRESAIANIIQREIKNYYSKFQKKYLSACKEGDSRLLKVAVDALRPNCFEMHWYNKGVRLLENHKKQIHKPFHKGIIDYSSPYKEALKTERKLKKLSVIDIDDDIIKRYYRGFPPEAETLILHYVFILITPTLHEEYLDDLAPMEEETYQNFIQVLYEDLQKNPSQSFFV